MKTKKRLRLAYREFTGDDVVLCKNSPEYGYVRFLEGYIKQKFDNVESMRDRIYVSSHADMNGWHHEVYMDNDLLYETDDDFRAYLFRAKLLTNE